MHWDQKQELWLPVKDYEGLYEVSNFGRVKSLNYNRTGTERVLKTGKNNCGYLYVNLCKDGKVKTHTIHRLVAQAFLDNPHNLPEVNHINFDKTDNRVENLEFCDRRYNVEYSLSKPVLQYTLDGELVREWSSAMEAGRQGGFIHQHISSCCRGKLNTHGGFVWRFNF